MSLTELSGQDRETLQKWGWRMDGDSLAGNYQTDYGNWHGYIRWENGAWQFYILDCPRQVLIGRHGACFRGRGSRNRKTVHWIHFHSFNTGLISGILAINQTLKDAMVESPANDFRR